MCKKIYFFTIVFVLSLNMPCQGMNTSKHKDPSFLAYIMKNIIKKREDNKKLNSDSSTLLSQEVCRKSLEVVRDDTSAYNEFRKKSLERKKLVKNK